MGRTGALPRQLAKIGGGGGGGDIEDGCPELAATLAPPAAATEQRARLHQYTVDVHRHPEHGLGITLDSDTENNAFVDALVDQPDGQVWAARFAPICVACSVMMRRGCG